MSFDPWTPSQSKDRVRSSAEQTHVFKTCEITPNVSKIQQYSSPMDWMEQTSSTYSLSASFGPRSFDRSVLSARTPCLRPLTGSRGQKSTELKLEVKQRTASGRRRPSVGLSLGSFSSGRRKWKWKVSFWGGAVFRPQHATKKT